jgi:hypothetical protein
MTSKYTVAVRKAAIRAALYDSQLEELIKDARSKLRVGANREHCTLRWWRGFFEGLVTAHALHAVVMHPAANPDNEAKVQQEYNRRYP